MKLYRPVIVAVVAIALAYNILIPALPASARFDMRSELVCGNIIAGNDYSRTVPIQRLLHYGTNQLTDIERFGMSFSEDKGAPVIAQTSEITETGEITGAFHARFCYCDFENLGTLDVGVGAGASGSSSQASGSVKRTKRFMPEFMTYTPERMKVIEWSDI